MPQRGGIYSRRHLAYSDGPYELPTWTNVLVTEDQPIEWDTEDGEPEVGEELAGRLVIGHEQELIIDLCGNVATNLLAVLLRAHHDAGAPLPACPSLASAYDGAAPPTQRSRA